MSTVERHDDVTEETSESILRAAPDLVEIRRNGGLSALVGVIASAVAIAYLSRAAGSGALLDWALFAVMGVVGAGYLRAFVDARTPLLVADAQGLRVRLGRAWRGLPWGALEGIEHTPRRGLLRDGRLVITPHNQERALTELDPAGRRQARVNEKLYGAPFAVPLGLTTRIGKGGEDLTTSLRELAGGSARILEVTREADPTEQAETPSAARTDEVPAAPTSTSAARVSAPTAREKLSERPATDLVDDQVEADLEEEADADGRRRRDPRPALAAVISSLSARLRRPERAEARDGLEDESEIDEAGSNGTGETGPETDEAAPAARQLSLNPVIASVTPAPMREPRSGARAELRSEVSSEGAAALARSSEETDRDRELPEGRELRRQGSVNLVEETTVWGDRVRPIATAKATVEPLVIDEFAVEPAADPVIGPDITAARTRIGLTVDALADRTRIRPHVIESIEVDDFVPCGGDFYARGHLRTLARVLGLDDVALLKAYDERYADAPISPRRVFEAELATGSSGGIRSTRGGPNWSLLIAVIMTLVLAWSVARLVMDQPPELQDPVPTLNGSGGPAQSGVAGNVTLKVSATSESHLTVTGAKGKVIFDADVEYGEVHRLDVSPPVTVKASDAGAIDVAIDGKSRGSLGSEGEEAEKTFKP